MQNDITWDKDDLKARVDLREVVESAWGSGRRTGKVVMYRARWRANDRNPSFAVYADGFKDFGTGDTGDVYTWLEREYGMTFPQALHWMHNRVYGASDDTPAAPVRRLPAQYEVPSAEWQRTARALMQQSQAYLWSDADDAKRVREYLAVERGLSEATIRRYHLGYNPAWRRTRYAYWSESWGRWRRARLAPGVVIPWIRDSALVALRIRCRVGRLADWLCIPPDSIRGEPLDKYRSFRDSRLGGTLFNGDAITRERGVLLVEGEFDAMLAQQEIGDVMTVATLGSASTRLSRRLRDRLLVCPQVISLFDQDTAGGIATEKLAQALDGRHYALQLPVGKDITEYVVERGGELACWLRDATHTLSCATMIRAEDATHGHSGDADSAGG